MNALMRGVIHGAPQGTNTITGQVTTLKQFCHNRSRDDVQDRGGARRVAPSVLADQAVTLGQVFC